MEKNTSNLSLFDFIEDDIDSDSDYEEYGIAKNADKDGYFNKAVIWGTDWTTETIANQLYKGNIDLNPLFQRRDAWNDKEKSKLIESLMLGIPVPPIVLAERKEKKNSYIVIDGKQRLLTIGRFYAGKSDNSDGDLTKFQALKLSGLSILKKLNSKKYCDIMEFDDDYINNIDNQTIRTIVIRDWPDEAFLYEIFLRLNTGSKKLSPQELRQALIPGEFLSFLDEKTASSMSINRIFNSKGKPDPRMKDVELALRFYAYQYNIENYKGNLKEFLDGTCKLINKKWENIQDDVEDLFKELENSIKFSYELLSIEMPFSRFENNKSIGRFNKAIFDVFSYYFSNQDIRELVLNNKELFIEQYMTLHSDDDFNKAVNDTTKEPSRVVTRFNKFADIIISIRKNKNIPINKFVYRNGNFFVNKY